jgi:peptidoglycan/LPS O-acetylase OafA/YrhL
VLANNPSNALSDVLQGKLSQFLGRISYSFYLYAEIVGIYVTFLLSFFWQPAPMIAVPVGLLVGIVICAVTIPIAVLAEKFVERPGNLPGAWLTSLLPSSPRTT